MQTAPRLRSIRRASCDSGTVSRGRSITHDITWAHTNGRPVQWRVDDCTRDAPTAGPGRRLRHAFEASTRAKPLQKGQTVEGTIVAMNDEVAFVNVGGKGEATILIGRTQGRGRRARSRRWRSHPGDGRGHGGDGGALASDAARRGQPTPGRGRIPRGSRGRRQGRRRRQGRFRGHRRAAACVLPFSHIDTIAAPIRTITWAASMRSGSSNSRKVAATWSCRAVRCSRRPSRPTRRRCGSRSCLARS